MRKIMINEIIVTFFVEYVVTSNENQYFFVGKNND
jgi:hypothetical protein